MVATIDGFCLHYEVRGSGTPVVCLHGFAVDSTLMLDCLEPVFTQTEGYQRIYLDLPGMGDSPADARIGNADDMLAVIGSLIDRLIGDRSFVLIGQSYGGYLSMGLLAQYADRVLGLFLICPCVVAHHAARILPQRQLLLHRQATVPAAQRQEYAAFLDYAVLATPAIWQRYSRSVLPGLRKADTAYLKQYRENGYALQGGLDALVFDKPTVVLAGRQDHVVGYQDALNRMAQFPRGSFLVVDAAGHNLQLEQPALFEQALRGLLAAIPTD